MLSKLVQMEALRNVFCFDSTNVTNALTHLDDIAATNADCTFFQEHSQMPAGISKCTNCLRKKQYLATFGELDPEANHNLAGVGVCSALPYKAYRVVPKSDAMKQAEASGRCMFFSCDVGNDREVYFINIYGWTGGAG